VVFRKRKAVPVIEAPEAGTLAEALAGVPDPRRPYGWRSGHEPIPLVALLQLTVVALLSGARSQSAVAQWGREPAPEPGSERVPEAVAIDGKVLRGSQPKRDDAPDSVPGTYLVAAYAHASGTVLGQVRAAGKGHELAAAKALLEQVPLAGRVVTADALLTQRDVSEQIVAAGGDYLFPIDGNQDALLADATAALSPLDAGRSPTRRPADRGDDPAALAPA
jgi:hypothetical protein